MAVGAQKANQTDERQNYAFYDNITSRGKNLKQTLMQKWSLIQNQPLLKTIYRAPPIVSYKKGKSPLKDMLVRAKL